MNVTLSSRTHSRWNVFLHPQHLSPAGTPDPGRGPDGAASAHRVVRATRPFRVEAMVVLPDHLHAVWSLPSGDADYSTRLSLLKRHVSQTVRHLLLASQSASRHKRRELALWQRRSWEHQIRDACPACGLCSLQPGQAWARRRSR